MLSNQNFKFTFILLAILCYTNVNAAFVTTADTVEIENFLLLTPIKKSAPKRFKSSVKEHLLINENEKIRYRLKDQRGIKRGKIIKILDNEIQVYNQVTGKMDYVDVNNIQEISRVNGWKAWIAYLSLGLGVLILISAVITAIFAVVALAFSGNNAFVEGFFIAAYSAFLGVLGIGISFISGKFLDRYKNFKIDTKYKIGIYSMKKLNK